MESERIAQEIAELKDTLGSRLHIMGHHYQTDTIIKFCDSTGDSLELARKIPSITAEYIVFCGVYFMAETAALLTHPGQHVYIPDPYADCMMALMCSSLDARNVLKTLAEQGSVIPLAYVNTSVSIKALVGEYGGAVLTSANAATMLKWALEQAETVLFLPDKHLGRNTATKLGVAQSDWEILSLSGSSLRTTKSELKKRLLLWPGVCPIHGSRTTHEIDSARSAYPHAPIYVHPECPPEIVTLADGAGSTSYLIKKAQEAAAKHEDIVLGTESNLVTRLKRQYASQCQIHELFSEYCPDMNAITLQKLLTVLRALTNGTATPVEVPTFEQEPAKRSLTTMLHVCDK